jgi:hypothetical protein
MSTYKPMVYISYAWDNKNEQVVLELTRTFLERGFIVTSHKKDSGYKDSVEAFEEHINQGECIILVVSDKYLRSRHCMYELVAADKNRDLRGKIFPIVLTDAHIYEARDRLVYIKYWNEQIEKLNATIKQSNKLSNLEGIKDDLKIYELIRDNFDHLTSLLSSMNALTPEMHSTNDYSVLVSAIESTIIKKDVFNEINEMHFDSHVESDVTNRLAGDTTTEAPSPDVKKKKPKGKIDGLTDTLLNLLDQKRK